MRIESGPTGERKVRTIVMFVLFAAGAAWFAYDGWVGYPASNIEEHLKQLSAEERGRAQDAPIYASVSRETRADAEKVVEQHDLASQRETLNRLYGGPPSFETLDALYYFGPAFRVKFVQMNGRIREVIAQEAQKAAHDISLQRVLAGMLCVVALYVLWLLARVLRTRLVLDDEGLSYRGRALIKWDEMTGLRTEAFAKRGWIDVTYRCTGAERKLRLDEYHLAKFDEIIDAICGRMGFENPLPAEADATEGET